MISHLASLAQLLTQAKFKSLLTHWHRERARKERLLSHGACRLKCEDVQRAIPMELTVSPIARPINAQRRATSSWHCGELLLAVSVAENFCWNLNSCEVSTAARFNVNNGVR